MHNTEQKLGLSTLIKNSYLYLTNKQTINDENYFSSTKYGFKQTLQQPGFGFWGGLCMLAGHDLSVQTLPSLFNLGSILHIKKTESSYHRQDNEIIRNK